MSAAGEPIKRLLRASLGTERGERTIAAAVDLKTRIQYALSASGRHSIAELDALRDRHAGERCVIVGNGPSLRGMDLSVLRGEVTFGLNRGYLAFQPLGFATSYLVAINVQVVE
ncbi:MAG: hypothetical protein M3O78_05020, partial [Chloroflexota bacterium]|nr:hypothetical protein [Chloroflexota bacterium]